MASGLPSVVAKLPGVVEILTEECGIVVDAQDAYAFAHAIRSLAGNRALRRRMGKRGKARIAELSLSWGASAQRYLRIFERVHSCVE